MGPLIFDSIGIADTIAWARHQVTYCQDRDTGKVTIKGYRQQYDISEQQALNYRSELVSLLKGPGVERDEVG